MSAKKKAPPALARNRKALHNYRVIDTLEVGMVLLGAEVKSIRNGGINLAESYVKPMDGELWLLGAHVSPYTHSGNAAPDPLRPKKLLLHIRELERLERKTREKGLTLVLLSVYLNPRGRIKANLALVEGKHQSDKRQDLKAREQKREMERAIKRDRS